LFVLLKNISDIVERMTVLCTSSNRTIWSSVRGGAGDGTAAGVDSEVEAAAGIGIGVGATIVEDGGARVTVAGLDAPASANGFIGVEPGFGGRDGCKGELGITGTANKLGSGDAGGSTFVSAAGVGVGAEAGVSCAAADSWEAIAAAAFARAWAKRSAFFMSCFLRISIRASSCLTFFTKSLTSPGLGRLSTQVYQIEMGKSQLERILQVR